MKSEYIGQYSRPDGYNGHVAHPHLVVFDSHILEVYPFGFFRSAYLPMDVTDAAEAKWMVNNHPHSEYR